MAEHIQSNICSIYLLYLKPHNILKAFHVESGSSARRKIHPILFGKLKFSD